MFLNVCNVDSFLNHLQGSNIVQWKREYMVLVRY